MANKFVENVVSSDQSIYAKISDHTPYYLPNNTRPMDGALRTNCGGIEYYDAGVGDWFPLPGCEVRLDVAPHYVTVLNWAMRKMEEERKLDELAERFPAFKTAKENYELMKAMVRNEVA